MDDSLFDTQCILCLVTQCRLQSESRQHVESRHPSVRYARYPSGPSLKT